MWNTSTRSRDDVETFSTPQREKHVSENMTYYTHWLYHIQLKLHKPFMYDT